MEAPLMIAVCGFIRCGTSCTAGILSQLGVPMGQSWLRPNPKNPRGFYEARGLHIIRAASFTPLLFAKPLNTHRDRVRLLKKWLAVRVRQSGPVIGGKLPGLCLMVPDMLAAWPQVKFIIPERPAAEMVASRMRNRKRVLSEAENARLVAHVQEVLDTRDKALAEGNADVLRYPFTDLINSPAMTIDKIIAFCGLTPTTEQRDAAIAFVDPQLVHYKGT